MCTHYVERYKMFILESETKQTIRQSRPNLRLSSCVGGPLIERAISLSHAHVFIFLYFYSRMTSRIEKERKEIHATSPWNNGAIKTNQKGRIVYLVVYCSDSVSSLLCCRNIPTQGFKLEILLATRPRICESNFHHTDVIDWNFSHIWILQEQPRRFLVSFSFTDVAAPLVYRHSILFALIFASTFISIYYLFLLFLLFSSCAPRKKNQ